MGLRISYLEKMNPEMEKTSADQTLREENWFFDLLVKFLPEPEDITVTGTPEEMIREAGNKAFWVSATMSAVWGPAGWATILPEIMTVMKIQMNLVYKIANCHQKLDCLNHTVTLLIFANALGLTIGPQVLSRIGTRLAVQSLGRPAVSRIARKIGIEIAVKTSQRAAGRWVPVLLAPVFGLLSRKMTGKIGREANRFFIEVADVPAATA